MTTLGAGREFDLIRGFLSLAQRHSHPDVRVGPGDDCAVIADFAISTDMSVEGVHFRRDWLTPEEIGYRAATAALSDLAAMAAKPVAAMVSIAVSAEDAEQWAQRVMAGTTQAIEAHEAMLVGGDLTRAAGGATIDVVVIGHAPVPVLRSTARIGDEIWVTGTLGGSAAAVSAWLAGRTPRPSTRAKYAHPVARIREALWLKERLHAMIDLSDGIAGDAGHLAAASGCRLVIDASRLPVHPDADTGMALQGGEDYELCMSAAPGALDEVRAEFERLFDLPLNKVGSVVTGEGVEVQHASVSGGFDHFQQPAK